jgi:hypothetical protein
MIYLKEFIIGSSFPVLCSFYYGVEKLQPKKTYTYYDYTMIAPIYLGLFNVLSSYIANKYKWSIRKRLFIFSVISCISTCFIAKTRNSYKFNDNEWKKYYIYLFIKYQIIWNIIIYLIEINI